MQIIDIRKMEGKGVKMFFTLDLGTMLIRDCKLMAGRDKPDWVALPTRPYEKDGATKYAKTVEVTSQDLKAKIEAAAIEAYNK